MPALPGLSAVFPPKTSICCTNTSDASRVATQSAAFGDSSNSGNAGRAFGLPFRGPAGDAGTATGSAVSNHQSGGAAA